MYFPLLAGALVTAHVRISALEAELKASREAWESANTAKVSAEKAAKSAENRAKKAEKALSDADQKQAQWEQSIAERLDKISVLVGSKCRITPLEYLLMLSLADICLLILFVSLWYNREDWGILEASSAKH
jgi:Flp pilus assembly protein TadB